MLGLPFETEELIWDTINFCRKIRPKSYSMSIFAPFYGTKLRDVCVENGFMENRFHEDITMNYYSILDQPHLSGQTLQELYYNFNNLVEADQVSC